MKISLLLLLKICCFLFTSAFKKDSSTRYINQIAVSNKIVNPHSYEYILNPGKRICGNTFGEQVFLLIVVNTNPANYHRRFSLRETWSRRSMFRDVRIVYLMGLAKSEQLNDKILLESGLYGDIIQENYLDTYKNLTLKGIMSLKWIKQYCFNVKYILKLDDDEVVNTFKLLRHLKVLYDARLHTTRTIFCHHNVHMPVIRQKFSKWYLSKEEYENDEFTPYCSGAAYILTGDLVNEMYNISKFVKFIWVDDFFMTGVLGAATNSNFVEFNSVYLMFESDKEKKFRSKEYDYKIFAHVSEGFKLVYSIWNIILFTEITNDKNLLNYNAKLNYDSDFNFLDFFNWAYREYWTDLFNKT